ncbi:MAG: hypothetical protein K2X87_19325 [Gemmataceae bacterium]|nr:hypothetical protein [Gemmataceae bacterium]
MRSEQYAAARRFAEQFFVGAGELAARTAGPWDRWYYVETRDPARLRPAGRATLVVVNGPSVEVFTYGLGPRELTGEERREFSDWAEGEPIPALPRVVHRQGEFAAQSRTLLPVLSALDRLGFWELSDFVPSAQILGGEHYVVKGYSRGLDTATDGDVDACLVAPGEAISPNLRRLEGLFRYVLGLGQGPTTIPLVSRIRCRLGI